MPRKLERKLRKTARRRGYTRARTSAYVYGTLRELGCNPKEKVSR
jgi:hypothetical protein